MCNALFTQPTQTVKKDPSAATLPVPPATPDSRMLGAGTAAEAAREAKRRKVRQALEIDRQTQ